MDTFERYEIKYLMTFAQRKEFLKVMEDNGMRLDEYGRTTIRNVYYDTENKRLIRTSLGKPVYKEKLRVRSYSLVTPDDIVFVELKKKYLDVVYKRRIAIKERLATAWLEGKIGKPVSAQIASEIEYFSDVYKGLQPSCFLSYEREAFFDSEGSDLRITLDENILARTDNMSLTKGPYGSSILTPGMTLLEVKCSGALPLWLVRFLSDNHIYKTSFSKYGAFYQQSLISCKGGQSYAKSV